MIKKNIKSLAKRIGIYEFIRSKKAKTYESLRDSELLIGAKIGRAFSNYLEVKKYLIEFKKEKILQVIKERFHAESAGSYGTSSPLNLISLYVITRVLKPEIFVETGVASGASSYVILNAMEKNACGALYSIDLPPQDWEEKNREYRNLDKVVLPENKRPGWLVPDSLRKRWTLIYGDARKELPVLLDRLGRIDAFYHDAEHTYEAMLYEYKTVWPRLNSGGVLSSDDVSWNEAFDEFLRGLPGENKAAKHFDFGVVIKK